MSGGIPGVVRRYTATEALGVSERRLDPSDPEGRTSPDIAALAGDPAGEWLRANDPRLRVEGIAEEMQAALAGEGLTVAEARAAFRKSGGRPTAALLAFRARVSRALMPMWEDDRRRDFMAQALDCDRKTLRGLMTKPPHSPNR